MRDGPATWALIVAIDEYDDAGLRSLEGPVADACEAVGWLRKLGVPDGHILLHASPSDASQSALDALGLSYLDAREPTIWSSIARLRGEQGSRLFVFLFGHGLYDPQSRRLFLTQEAGVGGAYVNLGIDEYRELFLSMSFRDQVLVMDGCLNYPYADTVRPTVEAAMHAGVTGYTAQPGNGMIECFAASQDQRAAEIDGRGAFARRLFAAIDPDAPLPDGVDFDFGSGERRLDVRMVMDKVIPQVERDAAALVPPVTQRPQYFRHGRAGAEAGSAFCTLPATESKSITVELAPLDVTPHAERVRVWLDEMPYWTHTEPAIPGDPVTFPLTVVLPAGVRAVAACELAAQTGWQPPDRASFVTNQDQVITLVAGPGQPIALGPSDGLGSAPPGVEINTGPVEFGVKLIESDGSPAYEMNSDRYRTVAARTGLIDTGAGLISDEAGIDVQIHEDGPTFSVDGFAFEAGVRLVNLVADEVRAVIPQGYHVQIMAPANVAVAGLRLELAGSAEALAGLLSEEDIVAVRRPWEAEPVLSLSPADLEAQPLYGLDPGAATVSLDLPWGTWSTTTRIPPVGETVVQLPDGVGVPPLRIGLIEAMRQRPASGAAEVWLIDDRAAVTSRIGLTDPVERPAVRDSGGLPAVWSLEGPGDRGPWTSVVGSAAHWSFPVSFFGPLGVNADSANPRAEPLSLTPSPDWDLLLSAGRLDALTTEQAVALTNLKWSDYLVGLAGAYAVYASGDPEYLDVVVANLEGLGPLLDVSLLAFAAEGRRDGVISAETLERLERGAAAGAVPVLRWGVPLAVEAARTTRLGEEYTEWSEAIHAVASSLEPTSVWTMWRTDPH